MRGRKPVVWVLRRVIPLSWRTVTLPAGEIRLPGPMRIGHLVVLDAPPDGTTTLVVDR